MGLENKSAQDATYDGAVSPVRLNLDLGSNRRFSLYYGRPCTKTVS
jgi:hypothetical protein